MLRPGVVWFGEAIPAMAMETASEASGRSDVFLSVGTSSTVWPAAGLAQNAARNGATVIEINPEATPLSAGSHCSLQGKSGEVLPELIDCLSL
jgi:NAD-dependent deacetylase